LCFRAQQETEARIEKASAIKEVDDRIVGLRREINGSKDVLADYKTFQSFLFSLSPEHWRLQLQQQQQYSGIFHYLNNV
jgi:hypothetical protein